MECKYCKGIGTITFLTSNFKHKPFTIKCTHCNGAGTINSWYEVFIDKGEDGTESIYKTDNKIDAIRFAANQKRKTEYPVHLDRWELDKNNIPQPIEELF